MSQANENEICSSRVLKATVEQVYQAFANPAILSIWWGPEGFTNTIHEFDLRPEGKWILTMRGPEKGNYENSSIFKTIVPNKLVGWTRLSQPLFDMEIGFDSLDDSTSRISFRMIFKTADECNKMKPFVVPKNEENFDRLERVLLKNNKSNSSNVTLKEIAEDFLKLTASGQSRKAFELYVADDFKHHNVHFKGDRETLMIAMEENAKTNPNKIFEIQRSLQDGNLVAVHSRIQLGNSKLELAVIHIFKFENEKIVELWDFGQPVPDNLINENGMF